MIWHKSSYQLCKLLLRITNKLGHKDLIFLLLYVNKNIFITIVIIKNIIFKICNIIKFFSFFFIITYYIQIIISKYRCAPSRQKARTKYLLTTKLFCGYCENMMVGVAGTSKNGTLHNYYTCKGKKTCGCKKSNIKKIYI